MIPAAVRTAFAAVVCSLVLGASVAPLRAQTPGAGAVPLGPSASELYRRLTQTNAQLRTYKAKVSVSVALKSYLPISKTLDGTLYFRQPDKEAVVFDTTPALAKEFQKVYPRIEAPSQWPSVFHMSSLGSDAGVTTFRLVPIKHGRVLHLDVRVDEPTATIRGYTWTYEDGGDISFEQTVELQSGYRLVTAQTGHVNLPAYKADVTTTIGGYELNVPIDDKVFEPAAN